MNAIENDVRALVDKELAVANERFPQFHSQHEGYAVIREEFEEMKEQMEAAEIFLRHMWNDVKANNPAKVSAETMMDISVDAACEAIQVAAMCQKFLEMNNGKKG